MGGRKTISTLLAGLDCWWGPGMWVPRGRYTTDASLLWFSGSHWFVLWPWRSNRAYLTVGQRPPAGTQAPWHPASEARSWWIDLWSLFWVYLLGFYKGAILNLEGTHDSCWTWMARKLCPCCWEFTKNPNSQTPNQICLGPLIPDCQWGTEVGWWMMRSRDQRRQKKLPGYHLLIRDK